MTTTTFGRTFDAARRAQGFTSQAQLDAFFRHYDHVQHCAACAQLDGHALIDDGYQPTKGECVDARRLYAEYLKF